MAVIHPDFVFVHAPKTGGTSIANALGGSTRTVPMHLPRRALPMDRPAFGFLRDPWERMASLYFYLWQSPSVHGRRVDPVAVKAMGFKRWLLEGANWISHEPQPDGMVYTVQAGRYAAENSYPGLDIVAADPDLPPQQRRPGMWYLDGCAYTGRMERLQADLDSIMVALNRPRVAVRHQNRTRTKPLRWRDLYDFETVDHVATYFARDIEAGGYAPPL